MKNRSASNIRMVALISTSVLSLGLLIGILVGVRFLDTNNEPLAITFGNILMSTLRGGWLIFLSNFILALTYRQEKKAAKQPMALANTLLLQSIISPVVCYVTIVWMILVAMSEIG